MRMSIYWFAIVVLFSCTKEETISDKLVGDWVYERETYNSFSSFEDPDTKGLITFRTDETGVWTSSEEFFKFSLEWDFQQGNTKISVTKYPLNTAFLFPSTTIYDITASEDDSFTFTYHIMTESPVDSFPDFEQFENIILTRIQ